MNYDKRRELIESMRLEMGISTKEEDDGRTEYIASSNTLKINRAYTPAELEETEEKEETLDEKLRKVAFAYKRDGKL